MTLVSDIGRRGRLGPVLGLALAGAFAFGTARAAPPDPSPAPSPEPSPALPPGVGSVLESAFGAMPGGWHAGGFAAGRDRVRVDLCPDADDVPCGAVRLGRSGAGCPGEVVGPWCLESSQGLPDPVLRTVRDVLTRSPDPFAPAVPAPSSASAAPEPGRVPPPSFLQRAGPYAASLAAVLLAPLVAGWIVGRLVRRLAGPRWRRLAGTLVGVLELVVAVVAVPFLPEVSAWDVAWAGLLAGLATVATAVSTAGGAAGPDWPTRLLGAVGIVLALLTMEVGTRVALGPGVSLRWLGAGASLVHPGGLALRHESAALFPGQDPLFDDDPQSFAIRSRSAAGRSRRVLHVGDSMVAGPGVPEEKTFVADLGRLDPGVAHVNAGYSGSGSDFQYLLVREWVERLKPVSRVVMYLDTENDVQVDLDRWYSCCDRGPLLAYLPSGIEARCPEPSAHPSRWYLFGMSPSPFVLRWAAGASAFARHLDTRIRGLSTQWLLDGADIETRWNHMEAILRTLQADLDRRGVSFLLVIVPARGALESGAPDAAQREVRDGAVALAARLGIDCLDPWDDLAAKVREVGAEALFQKGGDMHFNEAGHAWFSSWLSGRIRKLP